MAKLITSKLESKAVTKLEHNSNEVTEKEQIEAILFEVNYQKVQASDDTVFMQQPKHREFGLRNETEAATQVLDGSYVPTPETTHATRVFLANAAISHRLRHLKTRDTTSSHTPRPC